MEAEKLNHIHLEEVGRNDVRHAMCLCLNESQHHFTGTDF